MDAEERFHQKRMGNVKYYIHVKHIPLDLVSMNWTLKHVSVKGQIVEKNMPKRKPQVYQVPRRTFTGERIPAIQLCYPQGRLSSVHDRVEADFPACMRRKKDNNDDNKKKNEELKEKGGEDVPLCLRKTEEKTKTAAPAVKRTTKKNESGSSTLNRMKDGSGSKMVSGSKDFVR